MEQRLESALQFLVNWLNANVLTVNTGIQWACVVVGFAVTGLIWRSQERKLFQWVNENVKGETVRSILRAVVDIGNVVGFIILMQICAAVFRSYDFGPRVVLAASDLAVAWVMARLVTSIMPNRALAKIVVLIVWIVAALAVFDLLTPITDFLEASRLTIGETSISALGFIKGLIVAAALLQAAALAAQFAIRRIDTSANLSPSLRVLFTKIIRVLLYTAAILIAMSSVGIDLTSLAIFSSALGVGLGFGMKTIFSNYVAGIILLMDDSIKPGDTIEIGEVYGVVRNMHGRYASVLTRDGTEYLIPNEQLISGEVINWSYSDSNVRLKIPVGISYDSDVEKALELLGTAADGVKRVLRNPAPAPRLVGFGDNSVDLQLRIWIADAERGVVNVRSEVMLNIWNLFHEHGIEFPFPQRDVLLKPDSRLSVTLEKGGDGE